MRRSSIRTLACLSCFLLAACGVDDPTTTGAGGADHPAVGMWYGSRDARDEPSGLPAFLFLGADGRFDRYERDTITRGTWRHEGEMLHFRVDADREHETPACTFDLQGAALILTFRTSRGDTEHRLTRVPPGRFTPPSTFGGTGIVLTRFAPKLGDGVGRAVRAHAAMRNKSVATTFDATPVFDARHGVALLSWTFAVTGQQIAADASGKILVDFICPFGPWLPVRARIRFTDAGRQHDVELFRFRHDGVLEVNPDHPAGQAAWDAWQAAAGG